MMGINLCVVLGGLGVSILSDHGEIEVDRRKAVSCSGVDVNEEALDAV